MFPGVHDSLLVAYSVDSSTGMLVLSVEPHHDSAPKSFTVAFSGAVAHCFDTPLLPAILYGITQVPAADLIRSEWPVIERGFKLGGWPGHWASSLGAALAFLEASDLKGFQIESSIGLSGWVLAESVLAASGP
ncbi:MAG: hypothetical protein EON58_07355 [Alphaproteobacteria bacterium]|nr:MAG: hypothetical protein EON58_07355 [Alphaproteobacteria bacterium]